MYGTLLEVIYTKGNIEMRLFELLLLLSNVGSLALMIFLKKGKRKKPKFVVSGVSILLLIVHLIVEGIRVQLFFSYCLTILFLGTSTYSYLNKAEPRNIPRLLQGVISTLMSLMLILTAALLYTFPVFKLPEPTGGFKVGTQTFHFVDTNRDEIFDEANEGKRELIVQVWYPAQNTNGSTLPFISEDLLLKEEPLSKTLGLPSIIMNYLKDIPSHSYEDAEISVSSHSYPLIILNHGYKSSRMYHTSHAENLASHGYIVASIDHTYSTFATVFPDGRTTTMETDEYLIRDTVYRDKVGKVWTDDVTFTIDQFEQMNAGTGKYTTLFKGKLDLNRIGIFGHSYGGAAAYDSSYDARITAGINLDGGLYNYHRMPALTKPFMFMFSESTFDHFDKVRQHYVYTDEELKDMGATREEIEVESRDAEIEVEHIRHVAKHDGHVMYVEGTKHYNFADVQFLTPILQQIGLTGNMNPKRAATIINMYTLNFFDQYLKNKDGSLLEGVNSEYPEVKVTTSLFAEE